MTSLANDRFRLIWVFNVEMSAVSLPVHLLIVLCKHKYALGKLS